MGVAVVRRPRCSRPHRGSVRPVSRNNQGCYSEIGQLMRVCSVPGCATLYPRTEGSRCHTHRRQADKARGDRGYGTAGHKRFRRAVLERDVVCVICGLKQADVADHWPRSRKELIELGLNPNDPQYGRGVDKQCHDRETARNQPGGWNATN